MQIKVAFRKISSSHHVRHGDTSLILSRLKTDERQVTRGMVTGRNPGFDRAPRATRMKPKDAI